MKKNTKIYKFRKNILITVLIIIILGSITVAGSYIYIRSKLSSIKTVNISKDPAQLGISPSMAAEKKDVSNNKNTSGNSNSDVTVSPKIINILILGKDSRHPDSELGNSDAIMIFTIDEKNNKLKLTSIMRDSYVTMDGHSSQKLTNSHAFGGALFTLKTVNENYNMNITDYMQVDLYGFAKIIDYIGGVSINVTAEEVPWANYYIKEIAGFEDVTPPLITHSGVQTLNGSQAVAYSRIRYVGNSDFQRTSRQRTVLTSLFNKLTSTNIVNIPKVIDTIIPYVETSLKPNDIITYATYILSHGIKNIEQSRVPYDDLYHDAVVNGADVLIWDKQPTIDRLHKFIFQSSDN